MANKPDQHYTVLARKYRPQTFEDLIGQDAMVQTLRNAFKTGRIAQAYMLTGVRGVGKTTTARILARALNYSGVKGAEGPTVDISELGEHCKLIMESRHVDVLEMDAASHTGVDNIREIIESARYKPVSARYKVYIIDEVHMLSKGAFNALLKTLEEPPEHVKFIFATTEIRKVPVTVLSRCQRFDLRRVSIENLTGHFQKICGLEKVKAEDEALALVARAAEGSVRDGLSILDQAMALGAGKVSATGVRSMLGLADRGRVFNLLDMVFKGDAGRALELLDGLYRDGAEPAQLLGDLAETVHLITRVKATGAQSSAQLMSETERQRTEDFATRLSVPLLGRAWQMLLKGLNEVDSAPHPIAAVEMILVRMAYVADLPPPDEIIRGLGSTGSKGAPAQHSQTGARAPTGGASGSAMRMELVSGGDYHPGPQSTDSQPAYSVQIAGPVLENFEAVVAYVGDKRDLKLKIALETYVRLVSFKPGHIDLQLEAGAPSALPNELGQKLSQWTGQRWIVSLSRERGAEPIAAIRKEQEAAEIARIKTHPLIQDIFTHFPDAEIKGIRQVKFEGLVDPEAVSGEDE